MKQTVTRPGDIVVAIQLALELPRSLTELGLASGRSIGEVHNAVGRLRMAALVEQDGRRVDRESLLQFIRWGLPVAYPALIRSETVGVGTARLTPAPGDILAGSGDFEFVWADPDGSSRGVALVPLHPRVPKIVIGNPRLYAALAAVDLVRVGGTRERTAAVERLRQLLGEPVRNG